MVAADLPAFGINALMAKLAHILYFKSLKAFKYHFI
jgi:hypothetical protein